MFMLPCSVAIEVPWVMVLFQMRNLVSCLGIHHGFDNFL